MKKISSLFIVSSLALFLTSCLKDKNMEGGVYGMEGADNAKLAELPTSDASGVKSFAFDFENKALTVPIVEVRLTSKDLPKSDVTVTLSLANSATMIANYNTANGTSLVQLPTAFYTLDGTAPLSVVIPAGQRSGFVTLKTNAIQFDPSTTYALGFQITSISDPSFLISGNFKTLITTFGAKNEYDGHYEITGTCVDANGVYTGDYGDPAGAREYTLTTTGGQTGLFYDVSYGYPNYIIINISNGGATNLAIRPSITFDGSTKAMVSVVNVAGANSISLVAGKFNPSNHSIDFEWLGLGTRFHVTEHWKYLGPR